MSASAGAAHIGLPEMYRWWISAYEVDMKIFKTMLTSDGNIQFMDTIEYEGKMWLVPEWLDSISLRVSTPLRIIGLDAFVHQKMPGNPADFLVELPIPKSVFEGQIPPELKGVVQIVESPDIRFPYLPGLH